MTVPSSARGSSTRTHPPARRPSDHPRTNARRSSCACGGLGPMSRTRPAVRPGEFARSTTPFESATRGRANASESSRPTVRIGVFDAVAARDRLPLTISTGGAGWNVRLRARVNLVPAVSTTVRAGRNVASGWHWIRHSGSLLRGESPTYRVPGSRNEDGRARVVAGSSAATEGEPG
jgi:hypothetical protein